jgi:hypothetical protein
MGHLVALLGAALVYAAAAACIYFFTDKQVLAKFMSPAGVEALAADPGFQALLLVIHGVALLVALRFGFWFALAGVYVATDHKVGFWHSLKLAKKRSMGFALLSIIGQIIIQAGFVLFILPGVVLAVYLGFAPFAYVREKAGIWASLGRSRRAVSGHFFGVLGRMLLLGVICLAIGIVPVLGWIVAPCLALLAWGELHHDLTARQPAVGARPRPAQTSPPPRRAPASAARTEPEAPVEQPEQPPAPERVS